MPVTKLIKIILVAAGEGVGNDGRVVYTYCKAKRQSSTLQRPRDVATERPRDGRPVRVSRAHSFTYVSLKIAGHSAKHVRSYHE